MSIEPGVTAGVNSFVFVFYLLFKRTERFYDLLNCVINVILKYSTSVCVIVRLNKKLCNAGNLL